MAGNKNLHRANSEKNDEFYTQLVDIENELKHYQQHFKGKVIFCNCDDPTESNFFRYFALNFNFLGIKKLITTHFDYEKPSYKLELDRQLDLIDMDADGNFNFEYVKLTQLKQNGDFRSPECIELLKEADIVITNPPFSLFREYVAQLMEYGKKFVIVGNQNAITYKEIFKLIKENKIWLGNGFNAGNAFFEVPEHYSSTQIFEINGKRLAKFRNCNWFTNLDIAKRHETLDLWATYNPEDYPHYDNYNAIEVGKVKDIPKDWEGAMGVPITFLDKYNPKQFEIVKFRKGDDEKDLSINGKCPYFRILIKHKR